MSEDIYYVAKFLNLTNLDLIKNVKLFIDFIVYDKVISKNSNNLIKLLKKNKYYKIFSVFLDVSIL